MANASSADSQREMLSLATAPVRDACMRVPFYVDGALDLVAVCRLLSQQGLDHALVRDGERLGLFTASELQQALLRDTPPPALAVRDVSRFDLLEVDADAGLFEALSLMLRQRVQRLLVRDGRQVIGVLGEHDLVSFMANHSHLIALQIDAAASVQELQAAAARIDAMLVLMHDGGIRIERIARRVGELNRRLFSRLWSLLAPPEVVADSCLLVMGSEGRGEQLIKTDQDNALLLRDGFEPVGLDDLVARFSAALSAFGYPPCPGRIMVSNPLWRGPVTQFRETLREWVQGGDPEGPMHLAIFFDAAAVAGDTALLQGLREHVDRLLAGSNVFLARFAAAADQFHDPTQHWWTRLTQRGDEQRRDLKKLGTFPIVHGIRALSLCHGVREVGTAQRIRALVAQQHLDAALGRDLLEALHYLMDLKLRQQLRQRAANEVPDNLVRPSDLSTMDRDQLKDAMAIVHRLRALVRQRFTLDAL
jgi:CBS domain-containing protein